MGSKRKKKKIHKNTHLRHLLQHRNVTKQPKNRSGRIVDPRAQGRGCHLSLKHRNPTFLKLSLSAIPPHPLSPPSRPRASPATSSPGRFCLHAHIPPQQGILNLESSEHANTGKKWKIGEFLAKLMENKKNRSLQPGRRDSCPPGCSRWEHTELPQGQSPAGRGIQSSWTPDGLCPPLDSGWDQHSLAAQGWAVPGMAAPIPPGTAVQGALDPIPSTRTQPGSREPACPIPDSSFTGETLPEQSFGELSSHGIPGGARSPA